MNHLKFTNEQGPTLTNDSTGAAYDESRYPNAQCKPGGKRFKTNGRHGHITAKRNHALAFAWKTLSKLHRQAQLTSNAAASASTPTTMQTKFNRIFAATYKEACDIDPARGISTQERISNRNTSENFPVIRLASVCSPMTFYDS
jgi:hypothetical protein